MLPHKPSGPLQRSSSNILHHPQACRRQHRRRFHRLELSPPLPRNRRTPPRREDAQGAQSVSQLIRSSAPLSPQLRAVAQFQDRSRARLYAMDSEELGMVNAGAVVVSQTATPPILAAEEVVLEEVPEQEVPLVASREDTGLLPDGQSDAKALLDSSSGPGSVSILYFLPSPSLSRFDWRSEYEGENGRRREERREEENGK